MRKLLVMLIILLCTTTGLLAQKSISGKVTDEKGDPVANASVIVKGFTSGTSTKDDGSFSLQLPSGATTLVFSSIDMIQQEVKVTASNVYNVTLKPANIEEDEVVVVAYGTVKKADFTGSANQISYKDFKDRPILNPLNALVATGPGVQTTAAGGSPGSSPGIRVRGFGSINASASPLIVVDGSPYDGGMANINTEDIETITTLKDPATVAMWGSRAANGVIMITTKRGKRGADNVSFKVLQGFSQRGLQEYERVDAFQYYPLIWESMKHAYMYPTTGVGLTEAAARQAATNNVKTQGLYYNPFRGIADNDIVRTDGTLNPNAELLWADDLDWNKEIERLGTRQEYAVNYSGATAKSDYFSSFGFANEKGYILRSDWKRFTGRLNVNTKALNWFHTGLNVTATYNNSNQASDGSSTGYVNPFYFTRTIGPIYPVYAHSQTTGEYLLNAEGNRFYDYGNFSALGLGIPNRGPSGHPGRHIIEETRLNQNMFRRSTISARAYGSLIFTPWLKFTTNISTDMTDYNSSTYENTLVGDGAPAGRANKSNEKTIGYTLNQILDFNKKIGIHNVAAIVGHETYDRTFNSLSGARQGEVLAGNVEFPNFAVINSLNSGMTEHRIESYFGRINYDFEGKYFLSANFRRDGNSRFSTDVRWQNFWGAGAAWRLDKEDFIKSIAWINSLKLRAAYGQLGNDGLSTYYAYQGLYALANNNANEPGAVQSQLTNLPLTWESNNTFDIGIEFGLFRNRMTGTIEYYDKVSEGLIFNVSPPLSTGGTTGGGWSVPTNIGNMYNRGIEIDLKGTVVQKRDFSWELGVNASTIKNRITEMPEQNPEVISGTKKLMVGRSVYDFWLRQWYGVDPSDGAALYIAANTTGTGVRHIDNAKGGVDTVTTDISNAAFSYRGGSAIPKLFGGINNTFSYKSFSLNILLQYQIGGKIYDGTYAGLMHFGDYGSALHKDILNRWTEPGQVTNVPRMQNNAIGGQSDRFLLDASFLNIRSITLSYQLPKMLLSKINGKSGSLFIGSENVALFSKRKGTNINESFAGTNSNNYTFARIITAGLSLNF